jgi:hypothetical protein
MIYRGAVSGGSGGRIRTYDLWAMRRTSPVSSVPCRFAPSPLSRHEGVGDPRPSRTTTPVSRRRYYRSYYEALPRSSRALTPRRSTRYPRGRSQLHQRQRPSSDRLGQGVSDCAGRHARPAAASRSAPGRPAHRMATWLSMRGRTRIRARLRRATGFECLRSRMPRPQWCGGSSKSTWTATGTALSCMGSTGTGSPCPSARQPDQNRHRLADGWGVAH